MQPMFLVSLPITEEHLQKSPEEHLQKSLFATKLVVTTICVRSYDCEHLFL